MTLRELLQDKSIPIKVRYSQWPAGVYMLVLEVKEINAYGVKLPANTDTTAPLDWWVGWEVYETDNNSGRGA